MFLLDIILSNTACALLILIFLLIVGISSVIVNRNNKKIVEINDEAIGEKAGTTTIIENILKNLNCQFSKEIKEDWHEYNVKFQTGNFILICKDDEDFVRIHYPRFFTTSIDYLHSVRQVINECNSRNFSHHLVYTIDSKEDDITIHITTSCTIMDDKKVEERLADTFTRVFSVAQDFYIHFERNKDRSSEVRSNDIEEDFATYEREFFLLREGEKNVHDPKDKLRSSTSSPLTLGCMLKQLYDWTDTEFLELKVVNHETTTFLAEEEIAKFDITSALVAKDKDGNAQFIGNNATLILLYGKDKRHPSSLPTQLTISLQAKGRTPEILYLLATISLPPDETHNKNALEISTNRPQNNSFLIAYDTTSAEQKKAELKFLMDELEAKVKEEDFENLSAEEQLVYKFKMPNLLANIHYGEKLYRQERYYEAVIELESVYRFLNRFFHNLDKKQKQYFYDVCYYIGASYSRIGLYKKAYYYLDAIFSLNNFTYMEEYVNCLVNDGDHRSLAIIDNLINYTDRRIDESAEEAPDYLVLFKKFLLRRKSCVLIEIGALDTAQKICEEMLDDPENQDFALNELVRIQKLYEQIAQKEEKSKTEKGFDNIKSNNSDQEENK